MRTQEEIEENILFYTRDKKAPLGLKNNNVVSYILKDPIENKTFLVAFNGSERNQEIMIPEASWDVLVDKFQAGTKSLWSTAQKKVTLKAHSALVMMTEGLPPL